jgi:hypothetical protein
LISDVVEIDDLRQLDRMVPQGLQQHDFFLPDWKNSVGNSLQEALEPIQEELAAALPASVKSIPKNLLARMFYSNTEDSLTYKKMIRARDNLFARLQHVVGYQGEKSRCLKRVQKLIDNINQTHSVYITFTGRPLTARCMGFKRGGQKIVIWQWLVNLRVKPSKTAGMDTEIPLSICCGVTLEEQVSWAYEETGSDHPHSFLAKTETAASGLSEREEVTASEPTSFDPIAPPMENSFPVQLQCSDYLATSKGPDSVVNLLKINIVPRFGQLGKGDDAVVKALSFSPTRFVALEEEKFRKKSASSGRNDKRNLTAGSTKSSQSLKYDQRVVREHGSVINSRSSLPLKNVHNEDPYYPHPNNPYLDGLLSANSYEDLQRGTEWSQYTSAHGKPYMEDFVRMMSIRHRLMGDLSVPPTAPSGLS